LRPAAPWARPMVSTTAWASAFRRMLTSLKAAAHSASPIERDALLACRKRSTSATFSSTSRFLPSRRRFQAVTLATDSSAWSWGGCLRRAILCGDTDRPAARRYSNARDELRSDLVPDFLTLVQDGAFVGFPYSY